MVDSCEEIPLEFEVFYFSILLTPSRILRNDFVQKVHRNFSLGFNLGQRLVQSKQLRKNLIDFLAGQQASKIEFWQEHELAYQFAYMRAFNQRNRMI